MEKQNTKKKNEHKTSNECMDRSKSRHINNSMKTVYAKQSKDEDY